MDAEWEDEREHADWRSENDPADEDEHRLAQSAKEARQHIARYFRGTRNRQREQEREENQRHHRSGGGGGDWVRRQE